MLVRIGIGFILVLAYVKLRLGKLHVPVKQSGITGSSLMTCHRCTKLAFRGQTEKVLFIDTILIGSIMQELVHL